MDIHVYERTILKHNMISDLTFSKTEATVQVESIDHKEGWGGFSFAGFNLGLGGSFAAIGIAIAIIIAVILFLRRR